MKIIKIKFFLKKILSNELILILKFFIKLPKNIFFFLLYFLPAIIFYLLNYKFPTFQTSAIGHIIDESETFIKEKKLGLIKFKSIMLAPADRIANHFVLNLFNNHHKIIKNNFLCIILDQLRFHPFTKYDVRKYIVAINKAAYMHKINKKWNRRYTILDKSTLNKEKNFDTLYSMGLPKKNWYVCVHSREGNYAPHDEKSHKFRNSNIETFYKAMDFINSVGGYCIRLGDKTMKPINKKLGYIDYALSEFKSEEMDIFLAANCKFFIGSASGALALAGIFNIPLACANLAPMSHAFVRNKGDISIPKLYRNNENNSLIKFSEVMESEISNYRHYDEFYKKNITLVDNSSDEIFNVVKEQYNQINNNLSLNDKDIKLQKKFRNLFNKSHYSYYSESIISYSFLNKYEHLL